MLDHKEIVVKLQSKVLQEKDIKIQTSNLPLVVQSIMGVTNQRRDLTSSSSPSPLHDDAIPPPSRTNGNKPNDNDNDGDDSVTDTKSVTWATDMIQYRDHPDYYKDINDSDIWYNKGDYATFKKECEAICILAKRGLKTTMETPKDTNDNLCIRGLEHRISIPRKLDRQNQKFESRFAVFDEQLDQQYKRIYCPDRFRKVYEGFSAVSRKEAHLVGLQDEQEAKSLQEQKNFYDDTYQRDSLLKFFGMNLGVSTLFKAQNSSKGVVAVAAIA